MREEGLSGTPKRRFKGTTTDSDHGDEVPENLLNREFSVDGPNQTLTKDGLVASMSRKGGTLEQELVSQEPEWATLEDARRAV